LRKEMARSEHARYRCICGAITPERAESGDSETAGSSHKDVFDFLAEESGDMSWPTISLVIDLFKNWLTKV
jgi:hypothetical protein